jgi:hypothetical protein
VCEVHACAGSDAFLPQSACRRTARSPAMCSSKTSPDGIASPVVADSPVPNLITVTDILKKFFSGFERVTGREICEELRKDVYLVSVA